MKTGGPLAQALKMRRLHCYSHRLMLAIILMIACTSCSSTANHRRRIQSQFKYPAGHFNVGQQRYPRLIMMPSGQIMNIAVDPQRHGFRHRGATLNHQPSPAAVFPFTNRRPFSRTKKAILPPMPDWRDMARRKMSKYKKNKFWSEDITSYGWLQNFIDVRDSKIGGRKVVESFSIRKPRAINYGKQSTDANLLTKPKRSSNVTRYKERQEEEKEKEKEKKKKRKKPITVKDCNEIEFVPVIPRRRVVVRPVEPSFVHEWQGSGEADVLPEYTRSKTRPTVEVQNDEEARFLHVSEDLDIPVYVPTASSPPVLVDGIDEDEIPDYSRRPHRIFDPSTNAFYWDTEYKAKHGIDVARSKRLVVANSELLNTNPIADEERSVFSPSVYDDDAFSRDAGNNISARTVQKDSAENVKDVDLLSSGDNRISQNLANIFAVIRVGN